MKAAAVLAVIALSACATPQRFNAIMNASIGRTEASIVSELGPPESVYQLADGSRVIQYTKRRTVAIPGMTRPVTTYNQGTVTSGGASANYYGSSETYARDPTRYVSKECVIAFTIGPDNTVRTWSARGNDCAA